MSDFNTVPGHRVHPAALRAGASNPSLPSSSPSSPWRRVFSSVMERLSWIRSWRRRAPGHSDTAGPIPPESGNARKRSMLLLLFLGVGFLVAFGIFWYVAIPRGVKQPQSSSAHRKSLLDLSASPKPKPAPGKPYVAVTESHLPIPTVWTPAPGSAQTPWTPGTPPGGVQLPSTPQQFPTAPQTSPQAAVPQPVQPGAPGQPATFVPVIYPARHDKLFGGGCSGQLTLNAGGLTFQCPDDPGSSVQIALKDIGAVDENGIQTLSGKKYHFSISGMSKSASQLLFTNWLHQVR